MTKKKTTKTKVKDTGTNLLDLIIDGALDKKADELVVLDLRKLKNRVCDYFVICQGNSSTQVGAVADSIKVKVKDALGQSPYHSEGYDNLEWVLLDYVNIVVHVFQPNVREFYNIEGLWADAMVTKY